VDSTIPSGAAGFSQFFNPTVGAAPTFELYASLDSVNPLRLLVPACVIVSDGNGLDGDLRYPFGELEGVFWFSYAGSAGGAGPQDFFNIGTDRYRVFQAGRRTHKTGDFFAIREA
jgi:hypothetical protein